MNKHEICVHIKDEEMLQKAKELLEKHKQDIDLGVFIINTISIYNYLQFFKGDCDWGLADKDGLTEITLDQLEGIIKK